MYDKDLPKPKVEVNITILDILDVDIKKSTFDIYYVQEVFWYDYDLEYSFLKDIDVKNILLPDKDRNKIWSPDIKYIHLEKTTLIEEKCYIKKDKNHKASISERNILNMTESYNGNEHPIIIESKMRSKFVCQFDFSNYPFGDQACFMSFYLSGPAKQLTILKGKLEISDYVATDIGPYKVYGWKMLVADQPQAHTNHTLVTVQVILTREMTVTILVTHLPTLLMNLINQMSNYVTGESRYEFIITVNITCMMVLASIYLSVSSSLPNTPAIKPVEIWLLMSFIYPFMVITVNIALQVQLMNIKDHFFKISNKINLF